MRIAALIVLLCLLPGCSTLKQVFKKVDDACIVGRLGPTQAERLNEDPEAAWENLHDDYLQPVKAGDRLVNGDCADFSKRITQPNSFPEEGTSMWDKVKGTLKVFMRIIKGMGGG